MMSSLMPSEKYSCSGSPERLTNGSTAIAVRSSAGSGWCSGSPAGSSGWGAARVRFAAVRGSRLHVADEAKALSRDGADHDLILAAVADRLARGVDPARQRGFGDDAAVPHRLDQIVLGDDVVAVFDQVNQEIEHLRLDRDALAAAGQLAEVDIKHMVGKVKLHGFIPVEITISSARDHRTACPAHVGQVERIYRRERVRNLTETDISLKNQDRLKAKSARHHSL